MRSARPDEFGEAAADGPAIRSDLPRLTAAEDAELRQLSWFAQMGPLSPKSQDRLTSLKARDRRGNVRDVRPDPVTGHGARPAPLEPASAQSTLCRNCGFEARSATRLTCCPGCGQPYG